MNQEQNNFNMKGSNDISNNQQLQSTQDIKKKNIVLIVVIISVIVAIMCIITLTLINNKKQDSGKINNNNNQNNTEINSEVKKSAYWISSNSLEPFDLYFLQLENQKENKIYSPLSIKYALGMLQEGATGESKAQISAVIGDYKAKKYINSKNMSFANSIFIRDTYKKSIKEDYTSTLIEKYNAEVKVDSFSTPKNVNSWVSDKTLGLINNLFDDISTNDLLLINALGIDMEWEQKFLLYPGAGVSVNFPHEKFGWLGDRNIISKEFKDNTEKISGMEIIASFNNYDIVNVLGEKNIRQTVKDAYLEWLKDYPNEEFGYGLFWEKQDDTLSDDEIMEKYLDKYIEQINSNYKREDKTTDFSLYIDDNVKVFAKDLKEYNGTTLQYVGIMPTNQDLDSYINNVTATDINTIIGDLKELKAENFKDGVVTKITGFIPKFKFEYGLDLVQDLKKLGITNVFDSNKANLTNISSDNSLFITEVIHKANIEFTQDGIKAAAVVAPGGAGAAGAFDYLYEVPVEEIDLTFDKPYMFIIRDKNTGEIWFTGTVYNPLPYSQDKTTF